MDSPWIDSRRLWAGGIVFALGLLMQLVGVPWVLGSDLSASTAATLSGALLIGGELSTLCSVAIVGKTGYTFVKATLGALLRRLGPPRNVGRIRYRIGLLMFCTPIAFAWLSGYTMGRLSWIEERLLLFAIGGDLLLLASLFVLGGNFWDKLQALFVYGDGTTRRQATGDARPNSYTDNGTKV